MKDLENGREVTKGDLLGHYAEREPKKFQQFDGFIVKPEEADYIMDPDEDGHVLFTSTTYELMHGANVRVLVGPGTKPVDAVALLRKIADWIERDAPHVFDDRTLTPQQAADFVARSFGYV